jgi:hypothetical protein
MYCEAKLLYRVGGTCRVYRLHHSIVYSPFIADHTSRYYNHSITVDSDPLMSCVGAVRWCPLFLKASCPSTDWLTSTSTDCFFHTDCCLKVDLAGPNTEHLASRFISNCNDIVASETSVLLAHCIAVDLFLFQITVAWAPQWNVFVTTDISVPLRRCVVMEQYFRLLESGDNLSTGKLSQYDGYLDLREVNENIPFTLSSKECQIAEFRRLQKDRL